MENFVMDQSLMNCVGEDQRLPLAVRRLRIDHCFQD